MPRSAVTQIWQTSNTLVTFTKSIAGDEGGDRQLRCDESRPHRVRLRDGAARVCSQGHRRGYVRDDAEVEDEEVGRHRLDSKSYEDRCTHACHDAVVGGRRNAHAQDDAAQHRQHQGAQQDGCESGDRDAARDDACDSACDDDRDRAAGAVLERIEYPAEGEGGLLSGFLLLASVGGGREVRDDVVDYADDHRD